MGKYKLCLVDIYQKSEVFAIDEHGVQYGDMLCSYEYDDQNHYAIYENLGTDEDEDWQEWGYYETDFDKALENYKQLTKGDNNG